MNSVFIRKNPSPNVLKSHISDSLYNIREMLELHKKEMYFGFHFAYNFLRAKRNRKKNGFYGPTKLISWKIPGAIFFLMQRTPKTNFSYISEQSIKLSFFRIKIYFFSLGTCIWRFFF